MSKLKRAKARGTQDTNWGGIAVKAAILFGVLMMVLWPIAMVTDVL